LKHKPKREKEKVGERGGVVFDLPSRGQPGKTGNPTRKKKKETNNNTHKEQKKNGFFLKSRDARKREWDMSIISPYSKNRKKKKKKSLWGRR